MNVFLLGSFPYTPYRFTELLARLKALHPWVAGLDAAYCYSAQLDKPLTPNQAWRLKQLLPKADFTAWQDVPAEGAFWVMPRLGTQSPWSSKATDIAQLCGLSEVLRLERGIYYCVHGTPPTYTDVDPYAAVMQLLHDPLMESVLSSLDQLQQLFQASSPAPLCQFDVLTHGIQAIELANEKLQLALADREINYLAELFRDQKRNPTDAELMMFAQVNSEHCRHKIFNARWVLNGVEQPNTLFNMIRHTHRCHPDEVRVAYRDNAAILAGHVVSRFWVQPESKSYEWAEPEEALVVFKVETHNHPTAISPVPGAATGSGGEIRDEAATGRGGQPKAGLVGFTVSHLHVPDYARPWELALQKPPQLASAFEIMRDGPIGAAAFNNEFGRPAVCGYFRTFEWRSEPDAKQWWGYHKPIMIAGGLGHVRVSDMNKAPLSVGTPIVVLGGPGMQIGLGGGAASSRVTSSATEAFDFASVQRANPEMERRAQEVIYSCAALGLDNPILSIHDVGAGGLSNAVPELVAEAGFGIVCALRAIPSQDPAMSPLAIWCNEAQERFVLAIASDKMPIFTAIAARERCPFGVIGTATAAKQLTVEDSHFENRPVDLPLDALFGGLTPLTCADQSFVPVAESEDTSTIVVADAVLRVLSFPCVADKRFLVTIGDRSVGGLVSRDQMVGPWQVPVADVAVTLSGFEGNVGEAMAMGERPPIALLNPAASARMALGETLTNLAAAYVGDLSRVVLSANWMAAADVPGEGAALYAAVEALALELCPALGINIPVGKDSLSMRTRWETPSAQDGQSSERHQVTSPVSLVISGVARVDDVSKTLTPYLTMDAGSTSLILIDLGQGTHRLGGSVLFQAYQRLGSVPPDIQSPALLAGFFKAIQSLNHHGFLLAYHDRSDGGLLATVCEMMFASHCGIAIDLSDLGSDPLASLFTEALGAVIQVRDADMDTVLSILEGHGLGACSTFIGSPHREDTLDITYLGDVFYQNTRIALERCWSELSYRMQTLRDHAECAQQEYDRILDHEDPGLWARLTFDPQEDIAMPYIARGVRPRVAVLREQGINGHVEMAAAFCRAGFDSVDVHMTDLLEGRVQLDTFKGLVVSGGFSFGDVLGAGRGFAQSIALHPRLRDEFVHFFARTDTFTLGVCNGCQMLASLRDCIPGAEHWPYFERNQSEQFEARVVLAEITPSPSIFFAQMTGSVLPVVVSHGEGYAAFADDLERQRAEFGRLVALRYVDHHHEATERYPYNPNGSPNGITGLTTSDGRVTILMPHPERVFRTQQMSWHPAHWGEDSPWMRMFRNARAWVG